MSHDLENRPLIDLRSDTVTRPTQAMLDAMMSAKVVSTALLKEVRASASIGDGGRGR